MRELLLRLSHILQYGVLLVTYIEGVYYFPGQSVSDGYRLHW